MAPVHLKYGATFTVYNLYLAFPFHAVVCCCFDELILTIHVFLTNCKNLHKHMKREEKQMLTILLSHCLSSLKKINKSDTESQNSIILR